MTRLDFMGDRCCIAASWIGMLYIIYWHLLR
jgi:hypothetical protein